MFVSTGLNLIVVPTMYLIMDDIGARLAQLGARFTGAAAPAPTVANP